MTPESRVEFEPTGADVARLGLAQSARQIAPQSVAQATVATGTALFWACALDEQLWSVPGYTTARSADAAGRLLPGLRIARNAVAHGAAICTRVSHGMLSPVRSPLRDVELVWANEGVLRAALEREPSDEAWVLYRDLEGQPVRETIDAVERWFRSLD